MKAVDTNVLVYARIVGSPFHPGARLLLGELSEGSVAWAIPWPCIYEFLRVVTHVRVYHPPLSNSVAVESIRQLLSSPSLTLLSETPRHAAVLEEVIRQSGATGNLMHDAHVAALCLEHGITELVTGDRDFLRFAGIRVSNPFI